MDRRNFIAGGVGVVVGGAAGYMAGSPTDKSVSKGPAIQAKKTKILKMVTSWPKNYPGAGIPAARFGERLEITSQGRFKVRLYASGELVHPLKCLDAVQEGTADLYHSAEYYYKGKTPAFAFMTSVPFGFTGTEMDAWLNHGGGQKLWDELSAEFGVKAFPCTNSGVQMGGWFKKQIRSIDDIRGLKMRMPGLGGDVLNALGANAITLGGTEIMPALQSGTIDATEWVGPWNDLAFGFYKVVKNYMYPGFHEPGTVLSLGINKKFWDGLSSSDQKLFECCALAEHNYTYSEFNANNGIALDTLINKHGVKLHEMPDDVFRAFGVASKDVLSDAGKFDPISKKVYKSFIDFYRNITKWTTLSDQAYTLKRDLYPL